MKKFLSLALIFTMVLGLLAGCGDKPDAGVDQPMGGDNGSDPAGNAADLGSDSTSFGDSLDDLNAYAGYFEDDLVDVTVTCVSGTAGAYSIDGNTVTFTAVSEDSVYSISGKLRGNIVIDTGDDYKFDLELTDFSMVSDSISPITILSGDEVSVTAKKDTNNYIYDIRSAVDDTDETLYSAAIYSKVDLEVCGKGALTVISENNNGIHSKDDLQVKNLTLLVACVDNALKGNDSVELTEATTTLIATQGDGVKTTNTDISDKGNQRGNITVSGGSHTIYAACDGIDAAYNVVIDTDTTVLNIYTDKYSNYSSEVTAVDEEQYYIRFVSDAYQYSVKYYNSDDDYCWVDATYHSKVSGGFNTYYYYSYPIMDGYAKQQFFIYDADSETCQEEEYLVASDYLTPNAGYDTFALSSNGNSLYYEWTNYTTSIQDNGMGGMGRPGGMGGGGGFGGMDGGNTDKSDYSTKGIKAGNEVLVSAGTVNIKAYDDAIHANNDSTLENGETPTGNVTVTGGVITVYSNDDGLHADGTLTISNGTVAVTNSYEGLEGNDVVISGGHVSVISSDDGINGTTTSDNAITISGGTVYIYCSGDGIDSNSRTSYQGILFNGGSTVVISTSSGNSAIDTEQGYSYSGGSVIAVMPRGGMTSEATHCSDFSKISTSTSMNLESGSYLTVTVDGSEVATVQMPAGISGTVIYLGSTSAKMETASTTSADLDDNGVCWNE